MASTGTAVMCTAQLHFHSPLSTVCASVQLKFINACNAICRVTPYLRPAATVSSSVWSAALRTHGSRDGMQCKSHRATEQR